MEKKSQYTSNSGIRMSCVDADNHQVHGMILKSQQLLTVDCGLLKSCLGFSIISIS